MPKNLPLLKHSDTGLEALAQFHKSGIRIEELPHLASREIAEVVHLLSNGRGKARAAKIIAGARGSEESR